MATIEESIQAMIPQLTEEVAAKIRNRCLENLSFEVDAAKSKLTSYEGDKLLAQMMGPLLRGY